MTTDLGAWYRRALLFKDLHFYQKWRAVWPRLAQLNRRGVRLLDAGCGDGLWCLEIARRRPDWVLTGIDRDPRAIDRARAQQALRKLENVSFEVSDFSGFTPPVLFDVVLSVCSTHYGPTALDTEQLFKRMRDWLNPGGQLVLLLPRCVGEAPFVSRLGRPPWHEVFSRKHLTDLCAATRLRQEFVVPSIGRLGTLAKQLDWARLDAPRSAGGAMALLARGIAVLDAHAPSRRDRSLMWLLVAGRER